MCGGAASAFLAGKDATTSIDVDIASEIRYRIRGLF
jgi:hypothetical protein